MRYIKKDRILYLLFIISNVILNILSWIGLIIKPHTNLIGFDLLSYCIIFAINIFWTAETLTAIQSFRDITKFEREYQLLKTQRIKEIKSNLKLKLLSSDINITENQLDEIINKIN